MDYKNIYSKTLEQDMCYYPESGDLWTQDGTHYTAQEWQQLKGKTADELWNAHQVKHVFNGTILPPGAYPRERT